MQQLLKGLKKAKLEKKAISLKFDLDDYELLKVKAEKHAGGNVSAWVRYAALELDPKEEDLEKVVVSEDYQDNVQGSHQPTPIQADGTTG